MLIEDQPGYREQWYMRGPNLHDPDPLEEDMDEFTVKKGSHSGCSPSSDCVKYKKIIFPPLEKSLRLTSFVWRESIPDHLLKERTQRVASQALEGKLSDIRWDDYHNQNGRNNMTVHRGEARYPSLSDPVEWSEYMDRNGMDPTVFNYPEYLNPNSRYAEDFSSGSSQNGSNDDDGEMKSETGR